MVQEQILTEIQAHRASFGQNGVRVLTDATSVADEVFAAIETFADSTSYTADSIADNGDASVSLAPGVGHVLYGRFTNVVVTGKVIAYLI